MKTKTAILFASLLVILSCTKKDSENIPLPEHPRPGFEREVWQNLNGTWQFKPDSLNAGLAENWHLNTENFVNKIMVPFSWASPLSEVEMPQVDIGWYSRTFEIQNRKKWDGKNCWLVFCASDFNTTVWINGHKIGQHKGGYVPFDFNISDFFVEG